MLSRNLTVIDGALTYAAPCVCSLSPQRPLPVLHCRRSFTHLGSCQSHMRSFTGSNQSKTRRRTAQAPVTNVTDLPLIGSEDELAEALSQHKVIVVDWMAKWCRKCIYLKPKIQKMMEEEFPDLPIVYIDVNAVPGKLVYANGIKKMPTIALYQNKEKVAEHIAAEGSKDAVAKIKAMIEDNLKTPELAQEAAG